MDAVEFLREFPDYTVTDWQLAHQANDIAVDVLYEKGIIDTSQMSLNDIDTELIMESSRISERLGVDPVVTDAALTFYRDVRHYEDVDGTYPFEDMDDDEFNQTISYMLPADGMPHLAKLAVGHGSSLLDTLQDPATYNTKDITEFYNDHLANYNRQDYEFACAVSDEMQTRIENDRINECSDQLKYNYVIREADGLAAELGVGYGDIFDACRLAYHAEVYDGWLQVESQTKMDPEDTFVEYGMPQLNKGKFSTVSSQWDTKKDKAAFISELEGYAPQDWNMAFDVHNYISAMYMNLQYYNRSDIYAANNRYFYPDFVKDASQDLSETFQFAGYTPQQIEDAFNLQEKYNHFCKQDNRPLGWQSRTPNTREIKMDSNRMPAFAKEDYTKTKTCTFNSYSHQMGSWYRQSYLMGYSEEDWSLAGEVGASVDHLLPTRQGEKRSDFLNKVLPDIAHDMNKPLDLIVEAQRLYDDFGKYEAMFAADGDGSMVRWPKGVWSTPPGSSSKLEEDLRKKQQAAQAQTQQSQPHIILKRVTEDSKTFKGRYIPWSNMQGEMVLGLVHNAKNARLVMYNIQTINLLDKDDDTSVVANIPNDALKPSKGKGGVPIAGSWDIDLGAPGTPINCEIFRNKGKIDRSFTTLPAEVVAKEAKAHMPTRAQMTASVQSHANSVSKSADKSAETDGPDV